MFYLAHTNFNVLDLERSLKFYEKALDITEVKRKVDPEGAFQIVFLEDGSTNYQLELTWLRDRKTPYDLSDNEIHLALHSDDIMASYAMHQEMGCVCQEIIEGRYYFIEDPDGYWVEIVRKP